MQQIGTKRAWDYALLGGQGDPLGIVQAVEVWPNEQMVYAQPRICPGEWDAKSPRGFWDSNESTNLGQTTGSYDNQQKRENLLNRGICCSGRPQSKIERMWKEG